MPEANRRSSRRFMWAPIARGSLSQNIPWCTSSSWAPSTAARSKTSSVEETAEATRSTLLGADHLHADRRVVAVAMRLELGVEEGHDLVARRTHAHQSRETAAGAALRPRQRIGVPRFELGTSPTRTERATRLRHTPEAPIIAQTPRARRLSSPARRQKRTTCTCSPPGRVSDRPSMPSAPIANVVQMMLTTIGSPEGVLSAERAARAPGARGSTR